MTLGLPIVVSQAAGAAICGRCHWLLKYGSLGVKSGATIASGWANSTLGLWLRASRTFGSVAGGTFRMRTPI